MAITKLGKVTSVPKGNYSDTETYDRLDIVLLNGDSYICRKLCTGISPVKGVTTEYWMPYGSSGNIASYTEAGIIMPDGESIVIKDSVTGKTSIGDARYIPVSSEDVVKNNVSEELEYLEDAIENIGDNLAPVATSGLYRDLDGLPDIPDELADLSDDADHRTVTDSEKESWNDKAELSDIPGVIDNLTNTSATDALSANQGKVLKDSLNQKQDTIPTFDSEADARAHLSELPDGALFNIRDYDDANFQRQINEINNNLNNLLKVNIYTGEKAINANAYGSLEISIVESGYKPIGIVGIYNNSSTQVIPMRFFINSAQTSASIVIRNLSSSEVRDTFGIKVLMLKTL